MSQFTVKQPSPKVVRQAAQLYDREFRRARRAGNPTLAEVEASWVTTVSDETRATCDSLARVLAEGERRLREDRLPPDEARRLAVEVRRARTGLMALLEERHALERETAEAKAIQAHFDFLVVACTVYSQTGQQCFTSVDDYVRRSGEPLALAAAQELSRSLYGVRELSEEGHLA